jgi:hypothetical protein
MKDLQAINDYLAICEVKARYCRYLDTKDWAAWRDLFTEDYELDVTEGTTLPVIKGREAAIKLVQSAILNATTTHQVHSPEIQLDGDQARVIWAMQDRVNYNGVRPSHTGYGHYHERWVRQNGEWKIATLKLTRLQMVIDPAEQG